MANGPAGQGVEPMPRAGFETAPRRAVRHTALCRAGRVCLGALRFAQVATWIATTGRERRFDQLRLVWVRGVVGIDLRGREVAVAKAPAYGEES